MVLLICLYLIPLVDNALNHDEWTHHYGENAEHIPYRPHQADFHGLHGDQAKAKDCASDSNYARPPRQVSKYCLLSFLPRFLSQRGELLLPYLYSFRVAGFGIL